MDFIGAFLTFGILIAYFSGDLSSQGFNLKGAPALLLFALIIAYFLVMKRFDGTLEKRFFGIKQPCK